MFLPERKRERGGREAERRVASLAATVLILAVPLFAPASPSSAMRDYRAGKFAEAWKEFERLAEKDKDGDARLIFNAGTSAYRATNYDAATKCFTAALASRDLKLQQSAYYNLGNAQFRIGQSKTNLDEVQRQWEIAIKTFQNAVALDKNDADAANNLAYAKLCVEQINQLREAVRLAKEAADEAIRQRNYHRALEIMSSLMQGNPLAKPFEDYTKKLQNIDAIANPNSPQP